MNFLADMPEDFPGEEMLEPMLESVTNGLSTVIDWIGTVVTSLVGAEGALNELLPLFAIGVAISAVMLGIKVIRGFIWGA